MILAKHDGSYTSVEKDVCVLDAGGLPTKGDGQRVFTGKLHPWTRFALAPHVFLR